MITAKELQQDMNRYGAQGTPFIFGIDYEMQQCFLYTNPLETTAIFFDINGVSNSHLLPKQEDIPDFFTFRRYPISYEEYKSKFDITQRGLHCGDSFLLNLTVATRIETSLSLSRIFANTKARYRVYLPGQMVCFSPEIFIQTKNGRISSFPMKGTIDATIPNAKELILADYKETCEHNTIVDLIRNDLNQIGIDTRIERFRYVDKIKTSNGAILQVSSEVSARLPEDYTHHLGDLFMRLLPAGSISGAPKKSTVQIIREAEQEDRRFYTGIIGYFDGKDLDTGVMIRYIENRENGLYFRSGGGITINSNPIDEYNEVIEKVYLPF